MFTLNLVDDEDLTSQATEPAAQAAPVAAPAPSNLDALASLVARVEALQAAPVVTPKAPEVPVIDEVDFFLNPAEGVQRVVAATLAKAEWDKAEAVRQTQAAEAALVALVPDAGDIAKDAGFKSFLEGNQAAKAIYAEGSKTLDSNRVALAMQLYKASSGQAAPVETQAGVEVTTAQEATGVASVAAQTFSQRELDKLMRTDPEAYDRLGDALIQAYQEGRITA